jgi:signal transduction histidine kinase
MLERNNGSIGVSSTLGEGTVFTVNLPVFDTEEAEP